MVAAGQGGSVAQALAVAAAGLERLVDGIGEARSVAHVLGT